MEGGLDLLGGVGGGGGGDGGGASSGDSTNGSLSKAGVVDPDFVGLSSEVSSYPAEADLELGLGLSLGGSVKAKPIAWGEYGRILTANDFPSMVSRGSSASSSSSSGKTNASCVASAAGTKRAADSMAQEEGSVHGVSQVVGWPPIAVHRMNSLVNQTKVPETKGDDMVIENSKQKDNVKTVNNNSQVQEKVHLGNSLLVKVNMDGVRIGRKVDLNAHGCYDTLAQTLEEMFQSPTTNTNSICPSREKEHGIEAVKPSKLLDGSSEFVLTYEDKEGDLMLVGDVPWGMFLNTVKRLRIMRTSEANGLAPRFQDSCRRQKTKPI